MSGAQWPSRPVEVEIIYPDRWKVRDREIEDRGINEELQSDEQGADRRF